MKQPLFYERTKQILNIAMLSIILHLISCIKIFKFNILFIEIFLLSNILDIILFYKAIFGKEAIIYSLNLLFRSEYMKK